MYKIGEKEFEIKPLVIGQVFDLLKILENIRIPENVAEISIPQMVDILGPRVSRALAIVLVETGKDPFEYLSTRDLDQVEKYLQYQMTPDLALEVIGDFFEGNHFSLLLKSMNTGMDRIKAGMSGLTKQ